MAWDESKSWLQGNQQGKYYQGLLDDAEQMPARNSKRHKVVRPDDMPWEMARQGLLKHLLNESMNTRIETVDAYMQIIPPGKSNDEIKYTKLVQFYMNNVLNATHHTKRPQKVLPFFNEVNLPMLTND